MPISCREASPRCGAADLDLVWESGGGPVRQLTQHPLPAMLLPNAARQSTPGDRCSMAKKAALHLPLSLSHSPTAWESETGATNGHPSSPGSLLGAVVCRNDPNAGTPTLANP